MATVLEKRTAPIPLSESHRKVRSPLQQLRGYIRAYVITEAMAVLVVCLALFFWAGLLFDYGPFLLGLDWARDTPLGFRVLFPALGLLLVAFVVELSRSLLGKRQEEPPPAPVAARLGAAPEPITFEHICLLVIGALWTTLLTLLVLGVVKSRRSQVSWLRVLLIPALLNVAVLVVALVVGQAGLVVYFLLAVAALVQLVAAVQIVASTPRVALRTLCLVLGVAAYCGFWISLANLRDSGAVGALVSGACFLVPVALLVTAMIIKRLHFDFADESLALVLERRFPQLLGDRLITAVELSDPKIAAQYGYSAAMVEQTIHAAADAVSKLDIREVFDWGRLRRRVVAAGLLTVGMYLLVLGGMMGVAAARERETGTQQLVDLNDGAAIWAERNLLLDNERWPTRSLVRLKYDPAKKYARPVPGQKLEESIKLSARAVEYAVHDRAVAERWRVANLEDVRRLGVAVIDEKDLPELWTPVDLLVGWTVDDLKLKLQRVKDGTLKAPEHIQQQIESTIAAVDELAARGSMSRTLRRLVVPSSVVVHSITEDRQTTAAVVMTAGEDNEYTASLDGLTQSVDFHLKAGDYRSDTYRIDLVPPPRVSLLMSSEQHPAYRYHLAEAKAPNAAGDPLDDDRRLLLDKKQTRQAYRVDVQVSPARVTLPAGSDVVLDATVAKDLDTSSVDIKTKDGSGSRRDIRVEVLSPRQFKLHLNNVRVTYDFIVEFKDTDKVQGSQAIVVEPRSDDRPIVNQFKPEVVRQVAGKYLITPSAVVPFSFDITDNEGLASLHYLYSVTETPSPNESARRAMRVAAGVGLIVGTPEAPLTSATYLRVLPVTLEDRRERVDGRMPVAHFRELLNQQRRNTWQDTLSLLGNPRASTNPKFQPRLVDPLRNYSFKSLDMLDSYLTDHDKAIEDSEPLKGLDVALIQRLDGGVPVPLKARDNTIQRQYDMTIQLEVRDSNIDKPERGKTIAPAGIPIQFNIVSEAELIYEVGQEEQRLYDELYKTVIDLKKGQEQMQNVRFSLPAAVGSQPINFEPFSVQVEEVEKLVNEGLRVLTKVQVDYDRILRELRTNRVSNRDYLGKVKNDIVRPLAQIRDGDFVLVDNGERVRAGYRPVKEAAENLRWALDTRDQDEKGKLSYAQRYALSMDQNLNRLVLALGDVLGQMQGVLGQQEVLRRLVRIEQRERELLQTLEEVAKKLEDDFFK